MQGRAALCLCAIGLEEESTGTIWETSALLHRGMVDNVDHGSSNVSECAITKSTKEPNADPLCACVSSMLDLASFSADVWIR
jgi:hypothetical protein